mmetsp:Transcript_25114/g.79268  ORF Transcript_25114/g.79268 Transcript_25114/m.79268 type:complete len:281 (+) Transcript_25114:619-1461(+)
MGATSTSRVAFSTSATSPALRNARKTLTRPSNPTWLQSDMVVTSLATESALCRCRFGMLEVLGPTDPDLRGRMAAALLTTPRCGTCSIPPWCMPRSSREWWASASLHGSAEMLGSPHTPGASRDLAGLPGSGSQTSIVLNALPFAASARIGVATFCASVAVSAFGDRARTDPAAGGPPLPMATSAWAAAVAPSSSLAASIASSSATRRRAASSHLRATAAPRRAASLSASAAAKRISSASRAGLSSTSASSLMPITAAAGCAGRGAKGSSCTCDSVTSGT